MRFKMPHELCRLGLEDKQIGIGDRNDYGETNSLAACKADVALGSFNSCSWQQ